jgi:replicative DNA helicase
VRPLNEESPHGNERRRTQPITATSADRVPPHSNDAEMAVLGAMMLDSDAVGRVRAILPDADAFYRETHRDIYAAMLAVNDRREPVDIVTVNNELRRVGKLQDVGGPLYLSELNMRTPTSANAAFHARIVYERACRRRLIRFAMEILGRAYDDAQDAFANLEFAESELTSIARNPSTALREVSYGALAVEVVDAIGARMDSVSPYVGMESGIQPLDAALSGFVKTDLVLLAARPSMGKTGLGQAIGEGLARNGHRGLIISLEMSALQLAFRTMARTARVALGKMRSGRVSADEYRKVVETVERMAALDIVTVDASSLTLTQMQSIIRRHARQRKIDWFLVDYLSLGRVPNADNRTREVGMLSEGFKATAKETDTCAIVLSQLSRKVEDRGDKRPMLSDLRDSGEVEQNADVVMFLHRPEYYGIGVMDDGHGGQMPSEGVAEVIVGKHRNEATGTVRLAFLHEWLAFEALAFGRDDAPQHYPPTRDW